MIFFYYYRLNETFKDVLDTFYAWKNGDVWWVG